MLIRFIGGDHFITYTRTESLCHTPETHTVLYVNCISIKTEKDFRRGNYRKV